MLRKDRLFYCHNPCPNRPHTAAMTVRFLTPPHTTHTCVCVYIHMFASQAWKFGCLFAVSEVLPWVCSVYWELWEMRGGTGVGNCSWRRGRGCSLNTQSSCFGLLHGPENVALPSLHHSQWSQVPPAHMLTLLTHFSACKNSSHSNICLQGS